MSDPKWTPSTPRGSTFRGWKKHPSEPDLIADFAIWATTADGRLVIERAYFHYPVSHLESAMCEQKP